MASIATLVTRCKSEFGSLCATLAASSGGEHDSQWGHVNDIPLPKVKDELSRFKVWSSNIGAHRTGKSSLDYRLRDASNIHSQVVRLLKDLIESLADADDILSGEHSLQSERPSWLGTETHDAQDEGLEDDDDSSLELDPHMPSELSQIFDSIVEVINCLFRLSVSIRNPAPHDRFAKSALTDTSHFEPFDVKHVRMKFSSAPGNIIERLGKAISRRRQYFKYREMHHEKLASGFDTDVSNADMDDKIQSTAASSLPQHLKHNPDINISEPSSIADDDDTSDAGRSQTSYATSAANADRPKIPPLPLGAEHGPFECPFCFMMVSITTRRMWKKHIFSDLRPYICLSPDCPVPDQDFQRRYQWSDHVRNHHWSTLVCALGCDMTFESLEEAKLHLTKVHKKTQDSSQLDSLLSLCERPKPPDEPTKCPLCNDTLLSLKQYQRHVGRHQEDLALFALPQLPDIEREEDDEIETDEGEEDDEIEAYEEDEDEDHYPPRYCFCQRPSFGEMIACDEDNCDVKWFHLDCVGLDEAPGPKTKWYCPYCLLDRDVKESDTNKLEEHPTLLPFGLTGPCETCRDKGVICSKNMPRCEQCRVQDLQCLRARYHTGPEDWIQLETNEWSFQLLFPLHSIADASVSLKVLKRAYSDYSDEPISTGVYFTHTGIVLKGDQTPLKDFGISSGSVVRVHIPPTVVWGKNGEEDISARSKESSTDNKGATVRVDNVPSDFIYQKILLDYLQSIRPVKQVQEIKPAVLGRSLYVTYKSNHDALMAIREFDGYNIGGRSIRLSLSAESATDQQANDEEAIDEEEDIEDLKMEEMSLRQRRSSSVNRSHQCAICKDIFTRPSKTPMAPHSARLLCSDCDRMMTKKEDGYEPMEQLLQLEEVYERQFIPRFENFINMANNDDTSLRELEEEYKELSELTMTELVLKADAVDSMGILKVRLFRKHLANGRMMQSLKQMDEQITIARGRLK